MHNRQDILQHELLPTNESNKICIVESWTGMLSTRLLVWGISLGGWEQHTLILGSQVDLWGKNKLWQDLNQRWCSIGNSRAASFPFCHMWPEMMSIFALVLSSCCQKHSGVREVKLGSALAKFHIIFMLQHDKYVGNVQWDKLPLSLAD